MTAVELVAWNLRRLRVAQGVSQEALALDAEVDRTYVSRLEREMENPTINVLERLSKSLNVDIVALFAKPRPGAKAPKPLRSGRKSGYTR